jgi:tRNA pseudouridine32 synthase/23S rRNA pseudouridine746 synthase
MPIQLSPQEIALVKSLVIYEDAAILVLNKPAGLSSQGGRGQVNTLDELLWAFARPKIGRPRLIHRLDRDTSGVILTAKTRPAAAFLGKAMMARRFAKTYHALVAPGPPEPPQGEITSALRREEIGREAYMRVCADDHADAEAAHSLYRTLATGTGVALMQLSPRTGRMHQLRVHMAHIGRPILGDVRYGGGLMANGAPVPRLMLHACELIFPHPDGGEKRVQAPWPADLTAVAGRGGIAPFDGRS